MFIGDRHRKKSGFYKISKVWQTSALALLEISEIFWKQETSAYEVEPFITHSKSVAETIERIATKNLIFARFPSESDSEKSAISQVSKRYINFVNEANVRPSLPTAGIYNRILSSGIDTAWCRFRQPSKVFIIRPALPCNRIRRRHRRRVNLGGIASPFRSFRLFT